MEFTLLQQMFSLQGILKKSGKIMKKVYIILTHTGTVLSKIIKKYTKDEFSHVSIALDKEL